MIADTSSTILGKAVDVIPEGWASATIGQVVELNPPKPRLREFADDLPVTFVPMPAVDAESGAITAPEERRFGEVRMGYTAFRDNDVLLAKITPCMENGKAAIAGHLINGLGFGSTEFHVLRPTSAVIPGYVYHFIRQELFRRDAEAAMTGSVGQKRVPPGFVETAGIALPPLAEQKRIVAKVEELLAQVNAARERLDRIPKIMKRFRQAILAAACSGKLTKDWREMNLVVDSAQPLLEDILIRRRTEIENSTGRRPGDPRLPDMSQIEQVPSGWAVASIDQLTCLVTSGSRGWAEFYSDSGPLFIRAQNISTDKLCLNDMAHVQPPNNAEGRRTRVRVGDILITITGANVTKSALVDTDSGEAYVSQHVALARPVDADVTQFLFLWVISPSHGRRKLSNDAYGAGKEGLNLDNIRDMAVALPSLEEQGEIVRRVEALFKVADAIEKRVTAAKLRADKLTQSILAKAFRGELVPMEAELARREGRGYEPASVLLERIRAEKEKRQSSVGRHARSLKQ